MSKCVVLGWCSHLTRRYRHLNSGENMKARFVSLCCCFPYKCPKGALSRGFHRFLPQTILKLVVSNLIHSEHYLSTSQGRHNLISQRENKQRPLISIFLKTLGNNLKSLASIFQVASVSILAICSQRHLLTVSAY